MSDAARRAELEALQAETAVLSRTLAERPPVPPEQPLLEERVAALQRELSRLSEHVPQAQRRELAARDALDARDRSRMPWWQLHPGAAAGLSAASLVAAWAAAEWSLDHLNWPLWAERLGPALLAAPLAINFLRLIRVGIRDSWKRRD